MTPAISKGERHGLREWALAPGKALKVDDERRENTTVEVDKKLAAKARFDYEYRWINGQTYAIFYVGATVYCQPIEPPPVKRGRKESPARVKQTPHEEPPEVAPTTHPTKGPPARVAKPKRREPLGLL